VSGCIVVALHTAYEPPQSTNRSDATSRSRITASASYRVQLTQWELDRYLSVL
jgi:hypothetical protein